MKLPQLHLRDLFWLVLVCALAAGWWADRMPLAAQLRELQQRADRAEFEIVRTELRTLAESRGEPMTP
jgi:hypothetical protein